VFLLDWLYSPPKQTNKQTKHSFAIECTAVRSRANSADASSFDMGFGDIHGFAPPRTEPARFPDPFFDRTLPPAPADLGADDEPVVLWKSEAKLNRVGLVHRHMIGIRVQTQASARAEADTWLTTQRDMCTPLETAHCNCSMCSQNSVSPAVHVASKLELHRPSFRKRHL
jgi:hypothetical protein